MKRIMHKTWPTWMLYAFVLGFQGFEEDYPFPDCPFEGRWFDSAHRAYDLGWRIQDRLERMKI